MEGKGGVFRYLKGKWEAEDGVFRYLKGTWKMVSKGWCCQIFKEEMVGKGWCFQKWKAKEDFFRYLKGKWKTWEERVGRRKQGDLEPEDLQPAPLPLPQHCLHSSPASIAFFKWLKCWGQIHE